MLISKILLMALATHMSALDDCHHRIKDITYRITMIAYSENSLKHPDKALQEIQFLVLYLKTQVEKLQELNGH